MMNLFKLIHGWLSRLRGFLDPGDFDITCFYSEDGKPYMVEFGDLPRVILISDRLACQWDDEMPSLEELGYGRYDREVTMRYDYYARRPWVYFLKVRFWAVRKLWGAVSWGHGRLWYLDPWTDHVGFKWGRFRLGSGAASRACADAAGLRMQINAQYKEINHLKVARDVAYGKGMDSGWEQHSKIVEQFIDSLQKAKD